MISISDHKKVFLLRHSDAEYISKSGTDFDRNLSQEGQQKILNYKEKYQHVLNVEAVFCSSSHRTRETLRLLNLPINACSFHDELYGATTYELISFLQAIPPFATSVLLVGHNPGLSDLVSYLIDERIDMNPFQLVEIELEISEWKLITKGIGIEKRNLL